MKRKLIKQGSGGLTLCVPKKWTEDFNLKAGNEVDVLEESDGLRIIPSRKLTQKNITFDLSDSEVTVIRNTVINAYRAGFDKITINGLKNTNILKDICRNELIGFEVFEKPVYLQSISEPSYENYLNMVNRMIYSLSMCIENIYKESITEHVKTVMRYDNFLKRCISKKAFRPEGSQFWWQFFSLLKSCSRVCYHLQKNVNSKNEHALLQNCKKLLDLIKQSYMKNDKTVIKSLHTLYGKTVKEGQKGINKRSLEVHFLLTLARQLYITTSPLLGILAHDGSH